MRSLAGVIGVSVRYGTYGEEQFTLFVIKKSLSCRIFIFALPYTISLQFKNVFKNINLNYIFFL